MLESIYSGCGNTFILVDDRSSTHPTDPDTIHQKCVAHSVDGLILLQESKAADFKMRIFNEDGYEAEMCGNGIRCLGAFLLELNYPKKNYQIETFDRILPLSFLSNGSTQVGLGTPTNLNWNLLCDDEAIHSLNTGVPHAILFVNELDSAPIEDKGAYIRHHSQFKPNGTNVNFVKLLDNHSIKIRTFERGVERETEACGTGAAASALASAYLKGLTPPIKVFFHSKESIVINFQIKKDTFTDITMSGYARKIQNLLSDN